MVRLQYDVLEREQGLRNGFTLVSSDQELNAAARAAQSAQLPRALRTPEHDELKKASGERAVIGVNNDIADQDIKAFLRLKPGERLDALEVEARAMLGRAGIPEAHPGE